VEEERLSYGEVTKRLEIRKAERIERWVTMYRQEGELSFHKPKGRPRKSESEQSELERLRMENALQKNSIPNCGNWSSRSAISDDGTSQRRIRSEWDV
jgi:transposase